MTKNVIKLAFIKSLPVLAGYLALGIGFGILLEKNGFGVLWAFIMSITMYAGTGQYVGVGLLASSASIIMTALTTLMVNARHLFYSISMIEKYRGAGKKKLYLMFSLTDETYSLLCDGHSPEGENPHIYRVLVSFFDHCYWIMGCTLGAWLGSVITFDTTGIDFSMTALFVTVFIEQWLTTKNHIPAILGVVATAICLCIFGSEIFLIPSMVIITIVLLFMRNKNEKNQEVENG